MAVVGLKDANSWFNPDGLYVAQGTSQAISNRGGEFCFEGPQRVVEVEVDLTALPTVASGNQQIISDNVFIPKGAQIEKVDWVMTKTATGAGARLDLGLVQEDRATITAQALLAADQNITTAAIGTYKSYTVGSTYAGSSLGTVTSQMFLLSANANNADFTAGKVRIRVYYSVPVSADK